MLIAVSTAGIRLHRTIGKYYFCKNANGLLSGLKTQITTQCYEVQWKIYLASSETTPSLERLPSELHIPLQFHPLASNLLGIIRLLLPLTIGFCGIVALVHNQVLQSVVFLTAEVTLKNVLGALCVSLLRINRCSAHVRNHRVSASEGVGGITEWMVLRCWLWEPDITAVAAEMTRFQGLSDVFFDNNGTTGRVNEPGALKGYVSWATRYDQGKAEGVYLSSSWRSTPC